MKKYFTAGQDKDDNKTHAHFMLETKATNTHSAYVMLLAFPL
jgi:hypothetical protein